MNSVQFLLKNRLIFVIEDNPGNLAVLSMYLEQEGAKVKVERYGINTVQAILKAMPVDLIVTDLMLPKGLSGFDVYDQIRQVPELAHIPVVAVSAADPDSAMLKARQKGFAGFISKPVTRQIAKQLAEVLSGKTVWQGDSGLI